MKGYARKCLMPIWAGLLLCSHAVAAETMIACPPSIETAQAASGAVPEGWSSYGATDSQPLVGVLFFLGPPDKNMLLTPSREQRKGKRMLASWTFPASDDGYWVACEYAKTTVVVARRILPDPKTCSVEYDTNFSSPVARSWKCESANRK